MSKSNMQGSRSVRDDDRLLSEMLSRMDVFPGDTIPASPYPENYGRALREVSYLRESMCGREYRTHRGKRICKDSRAPDGIVSYGDRLVRKGGVVQIAGSKWQDDALTPFVGLYVGCLVDDYWVSAIHIYWPSYPAGKPLFSITAEDAALARVGGGA